jgi:hypothetical protein
MRDSERRGGGREREGERESSGEGLLFNDIP